MKLKLSWTSKLTLLLLLGLAIFLGNIRYQQWKNQRAIEQEKQQLQDQVAAMSKKNQELSDSLSYLNSTDFKDRVARQQLNLKRNGEVVFGFTDAPPLTSPSASPVRVSGTSNYEKWLEYFFGSSQ